jgi:hypothetical protein
LLLFDQEGNEGLRSASLHSSPFSLLVAIAPPSQAVVGRVGIWFSTVMVIPKMLAKVAVTAI